MRLAVFAVLVLGVIAIKAQDDGRYRPEVYGADDGRYKPSNEGRYEHVGDNRVGYNPYLVEQTRVVPSYYRPSAPIAPVVQVAPLPAATAAAAFYARPYARDGERNARILAQDSDVAIDGYRYSYQTENRINAEESGRLENTATGPGTRASGFYEYVGDDGVTYRVDYTADENGFHPRGAHLPQIPV